MRGQRVLVIIHICGRLCWPFSASAAVASSSATSSDCPSAPLSWLSHYLLSFSFFEGDALTHSIWMPTVCCRSCCCGFMCHIKLSVTTAAATTVTTIYLATRVNCRFLLSSAAAAAAAWQSKHFFVSFGIFALQIATKIAAAAAAPEKCCGKTHKKTHGNSNNNMRHSPKRAPSSFESQITRPTEIKEQLPQQQT